MQKPTQYPVVSLPFSRVEQASYLSPRHLCALERDPKAHEAAFSAARRLVAIAFASDRRSERPPFVIAVGGQVASGKSTLARALADRMSVPRVITDRVCDQLLHGAPGREIHESQWAESFEPGFHERIYAEALDRAEMALASVGP